MKNNYIYIVLALVIIGLLVWSLKSKQVNEELVLSPIATTTNTVSGNVSGVKKPPVKTPATKPSTVDTVKPVTSGTPASTIIDGSIYRMVTYKGIETPPDSKYTISFDNGYISAKICNSMSGSYYVEGILLKAGNLVSTKMYCTTPPGVMEVETTLDTMLTFGVNMYVSPNKVTLVNSQGIIMVFAGFTN